MAINAQRSLTRARATLRILWIGLLLIAAPPLWAQTPLSGDAAQSARDHAPFDPTGYWVSVIKQNWRFRMIVPGPGEYSDVPINLKAKEAADAWDRNAEEKAGRQCAAYGAAVLMRQPMRLHISWVNQETLKIETDNGMQTRLLHFKPAAQTAIEPSWQGYSRASWHIFKPPEKIFAGPFDKDDSKTYGSFSVVTDHLLSGLLRKNGIPYSDKTTLQEYWEVHADEDTKDVWMTISAIVQDPEYLQAPYTYNTIFKKEPDGSKWDPAPCSLRS